MDQNPTQASVDQSPTQESADQNQSWDFVLPVLPGCRGTGLCSSPPRTRALICIHRYLCPSNGTQAAICSRHRLSSKCPSNHSTRRHLRSRKSRRPRSSMHHLLCHIFLHRAVAQSRTAMCASPWSNCSQPTGAAGHGTMPAYSYSIPTLPTAASLR